MPVLNLHASHGSAAVSDRVLGSRILPKLQIHVHQPPATIYGTPKLASMTATPQPNNDATQYGSDAAAPCRLLLTSSGHCAT